MNAKGLGILSGFLALVVALGVAFSVGAFFAGGGSSALAPQIQRFASAAPATTNTAPTTRNAPAPPRGSVLTTEQIVGQVGPAVVTVINRKSTRAAEYPATRPRRRPAATRISRLIPARQRRHL